MNPESTKHFRSLPFLIITFIILFAFSVWYYLYQLPEQQYWVNNEVVSVATSTDEMADWKTYRNEKYGFEFKYPKEFNQKDAGNFYGANTIIVLAEPNDKANIVVSGPHLFPIDSFENDVDQNKDSKKFNNFAEFASYYSTIKKVAERRNIGGFDTLTTQGWEEYSPTIYVDIGNNSYVYININAPDVDVVYNAIFESLVNTANISSDWKTYRNEKYGFEFKYPTSYELYVGEVGEVISSFYLAVYPYDVHAVAEDLNKLSFPLLGFSLQVAHGDSCIGKVVSKYGTADNINLTTNDQIENNYIRSEVMYKSRESYYFLEHDNTCYAFTNVLNYKSLKSEYNPSVEDIAASDDFFSSVISSFKFTK